VVQLQASGPHVARHSVFSGPRKHSGKIVKSEIRRKACEVTFVLMNFLRWMQCICTRTMKTTFSAYHFVLFIYLFYDQIRRCCLPLTLRWGAYQDNPCVFSLPRHSFSWRVHPAQWSQYRRINLSIYPLNAAYQKWFSSQINYPLLQ